MSSLNSVGLVFFATLLLRPSLVAAQSPGNVNGSVKLQTAANGTARAQGFLAPAANPFIAPRNTSIFDEIIVVLDGRTPGPGATQPPAQAVPFKLLGESFERAVLPVVVGSKVAIKNAGPKSPALTSPTNPKLLPGVPVNPGERKNVNISDAEKPVVIRDPESAHITARIIGFKHSHFSTVGPNGSFSIKNVPAGSWKIRLWYRDRWLEKPSASVLVKPGTQSKATVFLKANHLAAATKGKK